MNPIVNVIEAIPQLVSENKGGLGDLIKKNYGSAEECQITILQVIIYEEFCIYVNKILNCDGDSIEISVFHLLITICFRTSLNMRLMVLVQITFMMLDLVLMDDLRQHGTGVTN